MCGSSANYKYRGLIPRAINEIFSEVGGRYDNQVTVSVSFLEIYNRERDSFALKVTNLIRELMSKYKDHVVDDKFLRIEHELKEIETEKCNILKQTLDKEMYLDTIISKSDSLKKNVKNYNLINFC